MNYNTEHYNRIKQQLKTGSGLDPGCCKWKFCVQSLHFSNIFNIFFFIFLSQPEHSLQIKRLQKAKRLLCTLCVHQAKWLEQWRCAVTDPTVQRIRNDLLVTWKRPLGAMTKRHRLTPHPPPLEKPSCRLWRLVELWIFSLWVSIQLFLTCFSHKETTNFPLFVSPKVEKGQSICPKACLHVRLGWLISGFWNQRKQGYFILVCWSEAAGPFGYRWRVT